MLGCGMRNTKAHKLYAVSFIDKRGNTVQIKLTGTELETIYQTASINQIKLSDQIQIYLGYKWETPGGNRAQILNLYTKRE